MALKIPPLSPFSPSKETRRKEFLATYDAFRTAYSVALSKADFEYQEVISSVKPYQKIVNPIGVVVKKVLDPGEFVINPTAVDDTLNIQKATIYFYKEDPVVMTIPSGIQGYPDFGPFSIDPIDHIGSIDPTGPKKDQTIDKNLLSQIYGNIFSGYTSPVLFQYLEVNDKFSPGAEK
jgi:hypothetical protein